MTRQHACPTSRSMCRTHLAEMRGCSGSRSLAALEAGNAGGGVMPDLLDVLRGQQDLRFPQSCTTATL